MIWKRMSMIAGPEQKADARNLGARIEAFQNGLAERPLYRKAVTVWMLTAQGIERMIRGPITDIL
jgi:hypothetical protein